jgi:putative membrane protein
MIAEALGAYAHFLSIFALLSLLAAEAALYRRRMMPATVALLRRLDLGYGIAAGAVIVTGLLRVFFLAKGAAFYNANPVFWVKMALFALVGLMSVPPTIHYIRTAKASSGSGEIVIPERSFRHIRGHLWGQLALLALIPLMATLMARGIGL